MKKRIKTAKDIKIDEIIKLVGQVNANNKKFNDSNDKYAKKQREKTLNTYFKEFRMNYNIKHNELEFNKLKLDLNTKF